MHGRSLPSKQSTNVQTISQNPSVHDPDTTIAVLAQLRMLENAYSIQLHEVVCPLASVELA